MSYSKFNDAAVKLHNWRKKNNLSSQHYEKTFEDVRDIWIKENRYSELISYIHTDYDSGQWDDFMAPLEKHLIENNLVLEYRKFWKGLLRHRIANLWDWKKEWSVKNDHWDGTEKTIECQKFALEGLYHFKNGLTLLKDTEELKKVDDLISQILKLEKPKSKPTNDKRKIDENLFWELIDEANKVSSDRFNFLDNLKLILESFHPKEIRNFDKFLNNKANELNTWDHWALAYIVRRGCGDDEFDYFKAWAVSKGKNDFNSIKSLEEFKLVPIFNEDPQLEEFYYLTEQIYEDKTSDLMQPIKVKEIKINGKKWEEDKLKIIFPVLCKLFNYS